MRCEVCQPKGKRITVSLCPPEFFARIFHADIYVHAAARRAASYRREVINGAFDHRVGATAANGRFLAPPEGRVLRPLGVMSVASDYSFATYAAEDRLSNDGDEGLPPIHAIEGRGGAYGGEYMKLGPLFDVLVKC